MKKVSRKLGLLVLVTFFVVFLLAVVPGYTAEKTVLRQVSEGEGSSLYEMSIAMAKIVNDHSDILEIATTTAASKVHNIRMAGDREVDVLSFDALNGRNLYTNQGAWENAPQENKPVAGWSTFTVDFFIWTEKDHEDINCLSDLAGKKFAFGPQGQTATQAWMKAFKALGIYDSMNIMHMDTSEMPEALITGIADATMGHAHSAGTDIAARGWDIAARADLKVVIPTPEEWAIIGAAKDTYFPWTQSKTSLEIYNKQQKNGVGADEVVSLRLNTGFGVERHVDEDAIYHYLKTLVENGEDLKKMTVAMAQFVDYFKELQTESLDIYTKIGIPVHPGVVKYLKEVGIWKDEWLEISEVE